MARRKKVLTVVIAAAAIVVVGAVLVGLRPNGLQLLEFDGSKPKPEDPRAVLRALGMLIAADDEAKVLWPPSALYAPGTVVRWQDRTSGTPSIICSAADYLGDGAPLSGRSVAVTNRAKQSFELPLTSTIVDIVRTRADVANLRDVRLVARNVTMESVAESVLIQLGRSRPACLEAIQAAIEDGSSPMLVWTAWRATVQYEYRGTTEISGQLQAKLDKQMNDILSLRSVGTASADQSVAGEGVYLAQLLRTLPKPKSERTWNCMPRPEYVAIGEGLTWQGLTVTPTIAQRIRERWFATVQLRGKELNFGVRTVPEFEALWVDFDGYQYSLEIQDVSPKGFRVQIGKPSCPPRPMPPTNVRAFSPTRTFDQVLELPGGHVAAGTMPRHFISAAAFPVLPGCSNEFKHIGLIANVSSHSKAPRISLELYLVHPDSPFKSADLFGVPPLRQYRAVAAADVFLRHTFTWASQSSPTQLVVRQAQAAAIVETPWYAIDGGTWSLGTSRVEATGTLTVLVIGYTESIDAGDLEVQKLLVQLVGTYYC